MKREAWLSCLCGTLLGTVLSYSTACCLITAFQLDAGSLPRLLILCIFFSAAAAAAFRFRWCGAALLGILAVTAAVLVRYGDAMEQIYGLIEKISRIYNRAYGWGYLNLEGSSASDIPISAIGVLIAVTVSGTVSTGKSPWPGITWTLLPLFSCFVVTDTVPQTRYLFALMAGLGVLILTASVRSKNAEQANKLTALVTLPVILALALLFSLNPRESYVNQAGDFQKTLSLWLEQLPQRVAEVPQLWEEITENGSVERPEDQTGSVDLRDVGPKDEQTYEVMDVFGTVSGSLYLRGQAFDFYSGTGWGMTFGPSENFPGNAAVTRSTGAVTVETRRLRDILYLPYYPMEQKTLVSGKAYNTDGLRRYAVTVGALVENWREQTTDLPGTTLTAAQNRADQQAKELYLNLPDSTRRQAQSILSGLLPEGLSRAQKAEIICAYVRSCAEYDLNTRKMPLGESDFALWFLEERDTGYCVHFATAAAVLLRAADIPARYVTGYLVQAVPGQTVTVTAGNAHAWTEYYEPALDAWIPLEATPSDGAVPETQPTFQPDPTGTDETFTAADPSETELTEATEVTQAATEATGSTELSTQESQPPAPEEPSRPALPGWLKSMGIWTLVLMGLVLAVTGQRAIRLELRKRRLRVTEPNALALKLWREAVMLARLLGQERPPRELERLAQKAKYSQHSLTEQELEQLRVYQTEAIAQLRERPWFMQVLYQYLYVIY